MVGAPSRAGDHGMTPVLSPPSARADRLAFLDVLRGIAASAVVLEHGLAEIGRAHV